jgi:hypothetical protein
VPRDRVAECFALTETASLLLVLGSSLTVQSGYRFVRRATGLGIPVAIINQRPTRGDAEATLTLDAPLGPALTALAGLLRTSAPGPRSGSGIAQAHEQAPRPAARPRPIPPARAARPQKIKGISIFVDCWYSG